MKDEKQNEIIEKVLKLAKKKYIKAIESNEQEQLPDIEDLLKNEL